MHGNVHEWCGEWFNKAAGKRVYRGGSWDDHAEKHRSAYRDGFEQHRGGYGLGFRVARTAPVLVLPAKEKPASK
jgi:formylglycine-generating enzyme required for sulfatase activity